MKLVIIFTLLLNRIIITKLPNTSAETNEISHYIYNSVETVL